MGVSGLLLGLPRQGMRQSGLGALHYGGRSERLTASGSVAAFGPGEVPRARGARQILGPRQNRAFLPCA